MKENLDTHLARVIAAQHAATNVHKTLLWGKPNAAGLARELAGIRDTLEGVERYLSDMKNRKEWAA